MNDGEPTVLLFGGPLDGKTRLLGEDGVRRQEAVWSYSLLDPPGTRPWERRQGTARYRLGDQTGMPPGTIRYDYVGEVQRHG